MKNQEAEIIIPKGCFPKEHEIKAASAFTEIGEQVLFLRPVNKYKVKNADVEIRGMVWEIKSPESGKVDSIERNLKRAVKQSCNIIFDSRRMHKIPAIQIRRELEKRARLQKQIKHLVLIDKKGKIVDIK